jgi:RHS repeat-associated protein
MARFDKEEDGVPELRLKLDVDAANNRVCVISYDRLFVTVWRKAQVSASLVIDGVETVMASAEMEVPPDANGVELPFLGNTSLLALLPPVSGRYPFLVRARLQSDPAVQMVRQGFVAVSAGTHHVLPVGHTFVKGVDLQDGHLVASSTDARIEGRGPALEVSRTYGSLGISDEGALGAGWNLNFHSRLLVTDCFWTIVGGDGSGQKFTQNGSEFIPQKGYHTSLRRNDDGSYDFFTKGRIRYHYVGVPRFPGDALFTGRPNLAFIEDTNGNRQEMVYDSEGNLVEVREVFAGGEQGRSLFFEYTDVLGEPRISKITGPLDLEILYEYDEFGNLVRATRGERVESYEYSVSDIEDRYNLTATVDPNGRRTEYVYFEDGDVFPGEGGEEGGQGKHEYVKEVREGVGTPELSITKFLYDVTDVSSTGRVRTVVTDGRNNPTEYFLNLQGSPVEIRESGNVVTTMVWSTTDIYKVQETNALGRVTDFEYDGNANLTSETIHAGGSVGDVVTEFEYDPTFQKMTLKRVLNGAEVQETTFEIDPSNGNLLSTTDAEGNVTEFEYAANGDLSSVRGPRPEQQTTYSYDAYGNPETATDGLGNVTTTLYDERSRLISQSDTFGRSLTQVFDGLDRVTQATREDSSGSSDEETIIRTYYPGGQVLTETNGLGLVTTFTLDGLNRVKATSNTLGLTTSTVHDPNGNVVSTTDRRGVVRTNTYDERNRLTQVQVSGPFGPPQTVATMDYDLVGNKLFETDVQGNRTEFVYDELYRVKERKLPTDLQNHVERFTYDKAGNKLTETDANGNLTQYEYDLLNRVTRRTDPEGNVVESEYDEAGNVTLEHDVTRGLRTEADYDALNRPVEKRVIGTSPAFTYVTAFEYDDGAHSVTQTDPRGFETTTYLDGFDRTHRVEQETGAETLVTTTFYDANGNPKTTQDAEGRETELVYDGLNRLLQVNHPLSLSTEYDYDGEGNKIEETNRRGVITRFSYDNLGRLLETELGSGLVISAVTYQDALRQRVETDGRGNQTTFEMDAQGRVVTVTDPDGEDQTFEYDGVNKTAEVDKKGRRTELEYDSLNRLTKVTDPLLQEIETVYDDANRRVTETDKRNLVKTTQLDSLGRLISMTRSGVVLEQHEYDGNGNRTLSTDANGNETQFEYDGANRLNGRTDGFGSGIAIRTVFRYDGVGNLLEEKDGRSTGKPFDVRNVYDDLNRLVSVEDAEGNVTTYEYDGEGNRTAVVEPKGASFRTEYDYGERNELIAVRMADGGEYQYEYDGNLNRTEQTDAEGNLVTFTYDALNRVDLMTQDPGGLSYVTNHDYDENGNETKLTDPKGQVIDFEYDELNRLKSKVYNLTAGDLALYTRTHRIDYFYDPNDNLTRIDETKSSGTDPPAIVSSHKTYDNLDRLETETDAWGKTLTYDYDPQGNRTLLIDPDSVQTEYEYDALNRLETLTFGDGGAVSYEYFPDGLKKRVTNPNGTVSTYLYDASDRMTRIAHTGPTGIISSYDYSYDDNGNRERQVETNAGRTETTDYGYDLANRLQTVTYEVGTADATQVTYTYDEVGNRLTEQEVLLQTSTVTKNVVYSYDAINRLEEIDDLLGTDDVAYTYDPNGNTLTKTKAGATTEFLYDIRNQLGEVQQGANVLGRYGYDSEGLRILKIGDDGIRRYTYDQLSVITEANQTNATVSKYDYGMDQLVRLDNQTEGRSFFHLDGLRSTVGLTNPAGGSRQSIFYDAWGNERDRVGSSANNFTFTGHEKDDETDLIYAKARFYNSEIGRFLGQDMLFGEVAEPSSLHRYVYALENPLKFIDPNGREAASVSLAASRGEFFDPHGAEGFARASGTTVGLLENVTSLGVLTYNLTGAYLYLETGNEQYRRQFEDFKKVEPGIRHSLKSPEAFAGSIIEGLMESNRRYHEASARGDTFEANRARGNFVGQMLLMFEGARTVPRISAGPTNQLAAVTADGQVLGGGQTAVATSGQGPLTGIVISSVASNDRGQKGEVRTEDEGGGTNGEAVTQKPAGVPKSGTVETPYGTRDTATGQFTQGPRSGVDPVDDFIANAEANGYEVVGREVSFKTPFGTRRADVLLRDPKTGKISGVEIKSTPDAFNRFNAQQNAADRYINRYGANAVGDKAKDLGVSRVDSITKVLWEVPKSP